MQGPEASGSPDRQEERARDPYVLGKHRMERRRKHPQHRGAVRKQESCCPQTPRWPRGSENFLILMLLDSPGPGAPTSVPSVTEAKRAGISLGSARRRCFSGGSWALANGCRVCKMGGSGHEVWGWGSPLGRRKVEARAPRARTQGSSMPPLQPLDGATGCCRPLHPERQGLPGAKTETLGQGPLVTQKDPPEPLQVPSPLRAAQC